MAVQPLPEGSGSQSSPFSPAPALPPPPVVDTPIRTRGSDKDRRKSLKILADRGASLAEMESFLREFVFTDPYKQSVLDLWREDPRKYAAETAWNVPKNVWSAVKSIPGVIKFAQGVKAEAQGAFIRKLGDIVGKDVRNIPIPGGRTLGELMKGSPGGVLGLSFGTENLDTLKGMPKAIVEDYKEYLTPEGRSTRIHDRPLDVLGDVTLVGGTALKTPTIARAVNKVSKMPLVAGSVVGAGTLIATQELTKSWQAAISAYGLSKGRKLFDAHMTDLAGRATKRADDLTAAQLQKTWDDAVEHSKLLDKQQARRVRAASDVHVHEKNIGKIGTAGSPGALEAARLEAIYHVKNATNLSDAERAMVQSAVEESVEARRAILKSEGELRERMRSGQESAGILNERDARLAREAKEQARLAEKESKRLERIEDQRLAKVKADSLDMNRAARQRHASAREYANLMDQRNARLAKEKDALAAATRERERFPDGREATGDATQTVTSSTTKDGVKTTTSQKFGQPEVEGGNSWQERFDGPPASTGGSPAAPTAPATPSAATTAPTTGPSRQAFDEWMKTKVSPLESNEMAPLTRRLRELERRVPPVMLLEEIQEMDWLRARIDSVAKRIGITYPAAGSPRNAVRNPNTGEIMLDPAPPARPTR